MKKNVTKLLIANRGEIARRIIRTARARGLPTVAIYSTADADAPFVAEADEAIHIGAGPASESYLNMDRVIAAAKAAGADAIHPGYGFFSENAAFAAACIASGLVFIGPAPETIDMMGDKAAAKRAALQAGVPCIPGYDGDDQSDPRLASEAAAIGYPVMIKAVAGGGGRGIRLATDPEQLLREIASARTEAEKAFGSGLLLLEGAILAARHVEVQVFGDAHGNVVHLGERDCSLQRRHQKLIEETPCAGLSDELRGRICEAAAKLARAVAYRGAGTVEFLQKDNDFFFLEMNTRLQVEHPVTEMVTGVDLVDWQIRVAAGEPLPLRQNEIRPRGAAMEARLCVENWQFTPQTGRALVWEPSGIPGVRTDDGLKSGSEISNFYDSMIAKIIVHGDTREEARTRLAAAIRSTTLLGIETNAEFLLQCIETDAFVSSTVTTDYLGQHAQNFAQPTPGDNDIAAAFILCLNSAPWSAARSELGFWSSTEPLTRPVTLTAGVHIWKGLVSSPDGDVFQISRGKDEATLSARLRSIGTSEAVIVFDGIEEKVRFARSGDTLFLKTPRLSLAVTDVSFDTEKKPGATDGMASVRAPMTGRLSMLYAKEGDIIEADAVLATLEAMKMEHRLVSPVSGKVIWASANAGEQILGGDLLFEIEPQAAAVTVPLKRPPFE